LSDVKSTSRRLWIAGVLGLVLAGISSAHPTWPTDLGVDFWNVPALKERLVSDRQLADQLATADRHVMRRIAAKETIIDDLVAGRIGLLEAAADFRALNAGRPAYLMVIRSIYPEMTDDERLCRNVIGYVEAGGEGDEDGRALIHRLTEELQTLKATGRLQLPGPPVDLDAAVPLDDVDDGQ
jgi:hypothetical protein